MTGPIRIALVGFGKIARDQHVPAIKQNSDYQLVGLVSEAGKGLDGLPFFTSMQDLASSGLAIDAVAICTPPQVRHRLAAFSIDKGWSVFLEKPPGASLAEVIALRDSAAARHLALFASWHSRFAPGVENARRWLTGRDIRSARIIWREDVRIWHPGQEWIWEPGGFGVFDPGINALSIATRILPRPFFVEAATLDFPENKAAPIAARISFRDTHGLLIEMDLDFRQEGQQSWDIVIETDRGSMTLSNGGAVLTTSEGSASSSPVQDLHGEYPAMYRRFADLFRKKAIDCDVSPMRLVADAFLRGRHVRVEAFQE